MGTNATRDLRGACLLAVPIVALTVLWWIRSDSSPDAPRGLPANESAAAVVAAVAAAPGGAAKAHSTSSAHRAPAPDRSARRVFGTVRTAAGQPIPDLDLLAIAPDAPELPPYDGLKHYLASARSNQHGQFEFAITEPGIDAIRIVQTDYIYLGQDRRLRSIRSRPIDHAVPGNLVSIRVLAPAWIEGGIEVHCRHENIPGESPTRKRTQNLICPAPRAAVAAGTPRVTRFAFRRRGQLSVHAVESGQTFGPISTIVDPRAATPPVFLTRISGDEGSIRLEFVDANGAPIEARFTITLRGDGFSSQLEPERPSTYRVLRGLPLKPLTVLLDGGLGMFGRRRAVCVSGHGASDQAAPILTPSLGSPTVARFRVETLASVMMGTGFAGPLMSGKQTVRYRLVAEPGAAPRALTWQWRVSSGGNFLASWLPPGRYLFERVDAETNTVLWTATLTVAMDQATTLR